MSDDKPKPLPCRVCGKDDLLDCDIDVSRLNGRARVWCERCDLIGPGGSSNVTAVALWNERCAASPGNGRPDKAPQPGEAFDVVGGVRPSTPKEALNASLTELRLDGVRVELHGPMFCSDPNHSDAFDAVTLGLGVSKGTSCRLINGLNHSTMLVAGDDHIVLVPVIQRNAV